MAKPENVKCCNCVFWYNRETYLNDASDAGGWCKRQPPQGVISEDSLNLLSDIAAALAGKGDESGGLSLGAGDHQYGMWPSVFGEDWCGEFRAEWPA